MTAHVAMFFWAGSVTICLLKAALSDIATRSIPNWVSLVVAALALPIRLADRTLLTGLGVVAAVFGLLTIAWMLRAIGGGDVKLWSACSLLAPPGWAAQSACSLRILLIGGLVAVIYLALRRLAGTPRHAASGAGLLRRLARVEIWRARRGGSIPYGVAISLGVLFMLWPYPHVWSPGWTMP
ncbi:MAG TPA: prepilin peptidase [Acidiphilium sp.]